MRESREKRRRELERRRRRNVEWRKRNEDRRSWLGLRRSKRESGRETLKSLRRLDKLRKS